MTQRDLIIHCFETKGEIRNKDFADKYQAYTGRNRVTEKSMKDLWTARGFKIEHFFGDTWAENGWRIVPVDLPVTVDNFGQRVFA